MGPRVSGSYNNEVLAVNFLKREIDSIQRSAHRNQKIYADVQIVSGAYFLGFKPQGMIEIIKKKKISFENDNSRYDQCLSEYTKCCCQIGW